MNGINWFFLFLAAALLLWFIALFYLRALVRRRTSTDYILGTLKEEVRLLEAEIDEKTGQNLELLEDRIGTLRELCAEAEKRIAVWTRELDRRGAQESAFAALSASQAPIKSAARVKEKKPSSPKKTGRQKNPSLLDSIEVRELNTAHAAKAYRQQLPPRPAETALPGKAAPLPEAAFPEKAAPLPEAAFPEKAAPSLPAKPAPLPETAPLAEKPRFIRSENPIAPKPPPMGERVAELYRAGFSEELIAVRLGITITEARLYAAMSKGR